MLAAQVYAYFDVGVLSSRLIGGGVGLLLVGAATWFYYLDDKRSRVRLTFDDELPTADEYEKLLQEIDSDDTDMSDPTPDAR